MNNIKDRGANTEEYWRLHSLETKQDKTVRELLTDMRRVYNRAMSDIDKEIEAFYGRYATENGLTMQEVHRLLDPSQLRSAKEELRRYYEFADPKKINPQMSTAYRAKLHELESRMRISRLEEIKARLENIMVRLGAAEKEKFSQCMEKIYAESHSLASFSIDSSLGFSAGYTAPSNEVLNKAIQEKWLGRNFSESIWTNKGKLLESIQTDLLSGIALGYNPRKIASAMHKSIGTSYRNCEVLARTESLHFANAATETAYKEHGVEKYQFVCGLDERTCPVCGELDGQVFELKYKQEGVNYPVMHPQCRCSTVPFWDDDISKLFDDAQRVARDDGGELYEVPADMTYAQWKSFNKFTEAKSIHEATNFAKNILKIKNVNYGNLPLEAVNDWNKGLLENFKKFPEIRKNINFVGECHARNDGIVENLLKSVTTKSESYIRNLVDRKFPISVNGFATYAQSLRMTGIKEVDDFAGITLNSGCMKNGYKDFIKSLESNVVTKWSPKGTANTKALLDHEIGHQIDNFLGLSNDENILNLYNSLTHEQLTESLCSYSWNNHNSVPVREFIAEAWSEYNSGNPRELAVAVGRIIEEKYKAWKVKKH